MECLPKESPPSPIALCIPQSVEVRLYVVGNLMPKQSMWLPGAPNLQSQQKRKGNHHNTHASTIWLGFKTIAEILLIPTYVWWTQFIIPVLGYRISSCYMLFDNKIAYSPFIIVEFVIFKLWNIKILVNFCSVDVVSVFSLLPKNNSVEFKSLYALFNQIESSKGVPGVARSAAFQRSSPQVLWNRVV